ncbi:ribosome recycling factor domain-containing protein [Xylaria digitata]|nr:ribosome recycling factor domain-containing protein [Xylaria digitata]
MSNAAARTLLRPRFARPQAGRIYDITCANAVRVTAPYSSWPLCQPCEKRPVLVSGSPRSSPYLLNRLRGLHTSPALSKSKKKEETQKRNAGGRGKSNEKPAESSAADDGPKHPQPSPDDPLNFADVESRLSKHAEHFRASLKTMQTGARFDPEVVGGMRVTVDKKTGQTYPLRELAQVVPRGGRAVSLLVHDAEYVKPIMSAVQSSPQFNQQPQRDPENELELILKIEPEKPEDLVKRAKAEAHEWRERIRAVRQKRDKLHATWKKDGSIIPDLKRDADKALEKIIKAAIAKVGEVEKNTIKAAESK